MINNIAIVGIGLVGDAIRKSFEQHRILLKCVDLKEPYNEITVQDCLNCDVIFLCLPSPYNYDKKEYDILEIHKVCTKLRTFEYHGIVVLKSTVSIGTSRILEDIYKLNIVHNPEFLTARTAYEDFHNQTHIILGLGNVIELSKFNELKEFYGHYYPNAYISVCSTSESEAIKLYCNSFYAVKIQFFNELYDLSKSLNINHNKIVELMLKNNWINPQHTEVPGPDGLLSYGGLCFPKDTNALLSDMIKQNSIHSVLEAVINERNNMRN